MASTHCGNRGTEVVEHGQSFTFRTGEKFCSTCVRQATAVYNYIILRCLSPERLGGLRQKGHRTQNLCGHSLSAHFQCTMFLVMSTGTPTSALGMGTGEWVLVVPHNGYMTTRNGRLFWCQLTQVVLETDFTKIAKVCWTIQEDMIIYSLIKETIQIFCSSRYVEM